MVWEGDDLCGGSGHKRWAARVVVRRIRPAEAGSAALFALAPAAVAPSRLPDAALVGSRSASARPSHSRAGATRRGADCFAKSGYVPLGREAGAKERWLRAAGLASPQNPATLRVAPTA